MNRLDVGRVRDLLQAFEFKQLFIEELGWSQPKDDKPAGWTSGDGTGFQRRAIARLAGVTVFELTSAGSTIPEAKVRLAAHREISKLHHENLLIFLDRARTQSLWYWVRRDGVRTHPRDHYFSKGQPGDLFLSKLSSLVVDIAELDAEGNIPVAEVATRLKNALDVERVTRRFFAEFHDQHLEFIEHIHGIPNERERRWYASVLLNRLMFIYFMQKKGFLDGGRQDYLRAKFDQSFRKERNRYFDDFLRPLFFEGFAKPARDRSAKAKQALGDIPYLNGGLFLPHRIEVGNNDLSIKDRAFENVLTLFERYSWNLDDTPGGHDDEINPDVLGYIFEKYINQKAFGAYYTRPEITEYLCEQTINRLILDKVNSPGIPGVLGARQFESVEELLVRLDVTLCRQLLFDVLPNLSILDPACGSGAFLVAALKTLIPIYAAVVGKIEFSNDTNLRSWLAKEKSEHRSLNYWIKKRIITDNLFGVDVMEEAVEIAKLRLFLALVASAATVDDLEPLPNIDFNLIPGNSLIGLMHVADEAFAAGQTQGHLFRKTYPEILAEKKRLIELYRESQRLDREGLRSLRDEIDGMRGEAQVALDEILLGEFQRLGIKFEQATWDRTAGQEGRPKRRDLTMADVRALQPFHWAFEFHEIVVQRGGFDAIITNPPWDAVKPQAKEFFAEYSDIVSKNAMRIEDFEEEKGRLLGDPHLRRAWLEYLSRFPHQSAWFRKTPQFEHQSSLVNGKRTGSDVNLYKLFAEQCFRLLAEGGRCGIVLPGGVYGDLGSKGIREMLFEHNRLGALLSIENRRGLFEGVDSRFKVVVTTFQKGDRTIYFDAAFRIGADLALAPADLDRFFHDPAQRLTIAVDLVRKLSPESLSVMEFKGEMDIAIADKMLECPLLGEVRQGTWNLVLKREFDINQHSGLFKTSAGPGRLPLFTGKMFNQFELTGEHSGYWINEHQGGSALGNEQYKRYRWVHRRIARNTDTRTMIATIAPQGVFTEVNSTTLDLQASGISNADQLLLTAVTNSFAFDWFLRQRVNTTLNMFHLYQMPVPRLTKRDGTSGPIVSRTARLVCIVPEYAGLWKEVVGTRWNKSSGATDHAERAQLRAELDGIVAHLYGLSDEEFSHILSTFPLVPEGTKGAALAEFRKLKATKADDAVVVALIAQGESESVEFKSTARWDLKEGRKSPAIEQALVRTVAGFLNGSGGTLLIGVGDDGSVVGLGHDYATLKKPGRDGLALFLSDFLLGKLDKDLAPFVTTSFHGVGGEDLCRIQVKAAPRPVYVKDGSDEAFYLRTGNSTRRLSTKEAVNYCSERWPRRPA